MGCTRKESAKRQTVVYDLRRPYGMYNVSLGLNWVGYCRHSGFIYAYAHFRRVGTPGKANRLLNEEIST